MDIERHTELCTALVTIARPAVVGLEKQVPFEWVKPNGKTATHHFDFRVLIVDGSRRATGKPLTEQAKGSNRTKSTVRVRVEYVFGAQANDMGGTLVRTIGLVWDKAKIGMKNLVYNMRRLAQSCRITPCAA